MDIVAFVCCILAFCGSINEHTALIIATVYITFRIIIDIAKAKVGL